MVKSSADETHIHTDIHTDIMHDILHRPALKPDIPTLSVCGVPLLLSAALRTRLVDGASIAVGTTSTQHTQWKQ